MRPLLLMAMAALTVLPLGATPMELRDPDVLYLDQNLPDKIILVLDKIAGIYLDKDFQTPAATLTPGTKVQIIGFGNDGNYLVSTNFRGTNIEGWMTSDTLPSVDPKLIAAARQSQAKRDAIQLAIKEKRVIQGMTIAEVKKSLGKPERTSFRLDAQARFDTWTYITYELIPQNTYATDNLGRTYLQTIYIKSPVGELTIEFTNGVVVGMEEHRRSTRPTTGVLTPSQSGEK